MLLQRTVAEVAALVDGHVEGASERVLAALRPPDEAGPEDLVALFRPSGLDKVARGRAGCVLLCKEQSLPPRADRSLIRVGDAEQALDRLVSACAPREAGPARGVHPLAVVEEGAVLASDVRIGPFVYVGARARIGAGSALWPGVSVGEDASVGADCRLMPQVVIGARCTVGDRALLHAGVVIGADGFGFRQDAEGRHVKIPQVGSVALGTDVEIGANSTVDRARLGTTRIGDGVKLDDQVHIGHNAVVGAHCAIAANSVLAGRAVLGERVLMGGCSGVTGGVVVGAGARIGGYTLVSKGVPAGMEVAGQPARARADWARGVVGLSRLPDLAERVRRLEDGRGADGP
jgi:UDP-3-O-[3-hydroxymyristoyl] glucosamine N-acyltransferase